MEEPSAWIGQVEFPATKIELIEAADEAGAPDDLIGRLQQLGHERYESRDELDEELAD